MIDHAQSTEFRDLTVTIDAAREPDACVISTRVPQRLGTASREARVSRERMTPDEDLNSIDDLVPEPVPSRYILLDPPERDWRGRACIVLWLLGFSARSAWLFALSTDTGWSADLRDVVAHESYDRLFVLLRPNRSRPHRGLGDGLRRRPATSEPEPTAELAALAQGAGTCIIGTVRPE